MLGAGSALRGNWQAGMAEPRAPFNVYWLLAAALLSVGLWAAAGFVVTLLLGG
jgi:hypothetical protein